MTSPSQCKLFLVRDEAQVLDARLLADKCDEFERQNQAAIRRFTEFDIDSRPS